MEGVGLEERASLGPKGGQEWKGRASQDSRQLNRELGDRRLTCDVRKRLERVWGQVMEVLADTRLSRGVRRQQRGRAGFQQRWHLMERELVAMRT